MLIAKDAGPLRMPSITEGVPVWCALGHLREPACWPGPYPKDDLQSPGELEVMINCQAIALNQARKPRTNEREPHVAPRHYGRT